MHNDSFGLHPDIEKTIDGGATNVGAVDCKWTNECRNCTSCCFQDDGVVIHGEIAQTASGDPGNMCIAWSVLKVCVKKFHRISISMMVQIALSSRPVALVLP